MSFAEILGTGLVAGIAVQLFQALREWFFLRQEKELVAARQALELSNVIRQFSIQCEIELNRYQRAAYEEYTWEGKVSSIPELPESGLLSAAISLNQVNEALLSEIADFEMMLMLNRGYLDTWWRMRGGSEEFIDRNEKLLKLAKETSEKIARDLRESHGLPGFGEMPDEVHSS